MLTDWTRVEEISGAFSCVCQEWAKPALPPQQTGLFCPFFFPFTLFLLSSVQFSSVVQSCPTLCDPMGYSMLHFLDHYQLQEFYQTHVHWVSDAIQPSHLLSSPSPSAFNLSQHQGFFLVSQFFVSGGQSTGVSASKSALSMNIQDFRMYWFDLLAVQGTLKSLL